MSPARSSSLKCSQFAQLGTRFEFAISTRGASGCVLNTPTGLPDCTRRDSSASRLFREFTMASKQSQLRAALPMPPYTTRSSGRSATSGSRLFISMRSGASVSQLFALSCVPRAARTGRDFIGVTSLHRSTGEKMKRIFAVSILALAAQPVASQVKVNIGISGWTGFAPLTLAAQAGIFKKNGVEATIKKIPQPSRHLDIASGAIQCAATTVETWLVWNANGVATRQIFQMDKSFGADGMAARAAVGKIADLKGKTIGSQAPGTSPYFVMAWVVEKK